MKGASVQSKKDLHDEQGSNAETTIIRRLNSIYCFEICTPWADYRLYQPAKVARTTHTHAIRISCRHDERILFMRTSLLTITPILSNTADASGRKGATGSLSAVSHATPPTPPISCMGSEQAAFPAAAALWRLRGRVRWVKQRVILEWQTKEEATPSNFVAYRSQTMVWQAARPLDLSIFATHDSPPGFITYRAVDTTAIPPGPYFYWLVKLTAKHNEAPFGPYLVHIDNNLEFYAEAPE